MQINTIEQWEEVSRQLSGYSLYQMQYGIDSPHGFIARFLSGDSRVEFVTFNPAVKDAMIRFKG